MKVIKWQFESLEVPMIDIDGNLCCTSKAICSALGVTLNTIKLCYQNHRDEIGNSLEGLNDTLRDFLYSNKVELGIKRVKSDINIWSEDQMITFACHIKSKKAVQFRKDLITMIKQHAKKDTITLEMYQNLEAKFENLQHSFNVVIQKIEAVQTPMSKIASESGKLLRMQKDVKAFRTNRLIGTV